MTCHGRTGRWRVFVCSLKWNRLKKSVSLHHLPRTTCQSGIMCYWVGQCVFILGVRSCKDVSHTTMIKLDLNVYSWRYSIAELRSSLKQDDVFSGSWLGVSWGGSRSMVINSMYRLVESTYSLYFITMHNQDFIIIIQFTTQYYQLPALVLSWEKAVVPLGTVEPWGASPLLVRVGWSRDEELGTFWTKSQSASLLSRKENS